MQIALLQYDRKWQIMQMCRFTAFGIHILNNLRLQ